MPELPIYPTTLFFLSGEAMVSYATSESFSLGRGTTGLVPTSARILAEATGFMGYRINQSEENYSERIILITRDKLVSLWITLLGRTGNNSL